MFDNKCYYVIMIKTDHYLAIKMEIKKKMVILKMKKKSKIRYLLVIFIIAIMTGFTCTFATAKEENPRKSTKLVFNAIEWIDMDPEPPNPPVVPPPEISFVEDGILHIKDFWSVHLLGGTIGGEVITGSTKSLFHAKIPLDPETGIPDFGNMVLNGKTWFYFTWGDLTGYFTGTVNAKFVSGILSGKYTLQGFGDFEGMKLFGRVWNEDAITNGLLGTILVPN